ncbi:hypothetical protein Dimus_013033 [Dionaea muscipula]
MAKRGRPRKVVVGRSPIQTDCGQDVGKGVEIVGDEQGCEGLVPVTVEWEEGEGVGQQFQGEGQISWGLEAEGLPITRGSHDSGLEPQYLRVLKSGSEVVRDDSTAARDEGLLSGKRRRHRISSLIRDDGSLVGTNEEIGAEFIDFFGNLLGSDGTVRECITPDTISAGPVLPVEHKLMLQAPFSVHDVKRALGEINIDKAPGIV